MKGLIAILLFALPLGAQNLRGGGIRVSALNNHWAVQSRGAAFLWDHSRATMNLVDGPQVAIPTSHAAAFRPDGTAENNPCCGGYASYPLTVAANAKFDLGTQFAVSITQRRVTGVTGYDISHANFWAVVHGLTAGKYQFYSGAGKYSGTNPATNSQLSATVGRYSTQTYSYAPRNWCRSQNGSLLSAACATDTFTLNTSTASPVSIAAYNNAMGSVDPVTGSDTVLSFAGVWNTALADRDVLANQRAINRLMAARGQLDSDYDGIVVFAGDSATAADTLTDNWAGRYPPQVMTNLLADRKLDWVNLGVSSGRLSGTGRVSKDATLVDPLYGLWGTVGKTNICIIWAGSNDHYIDGTTVAALQTAIQTYAQARIAVGWKVVVVPIIARGDVNKETTRLEFNTWLAANYASWGAAGTIAYADATADANLNSYEAAFNATYFLPDHMHPTAAGYAIVANSVITAIRSIW